jgi:putative FmdB family regulatory protein
MPIYEYACPDCGHLNDHLQKLADAPIAACPKCASTQYYKKISAAGFALKGTGWYVTDFRNGNSGQKPGDKPGDKAGDKKEGDAAATPAPAAATPAAKEGNTTSPSTSAAPAAAPAAPAAAAPAPAPAPSAANSK